MNLSRQQVLEMATIEQSKPDPKSRWIDFEFGDGKTGLVRVFANQKRTQPARVRAQAKEIGQRPSPLAMLAEPKPGTDQYGVSLEVLRGEIDPMFTYEVAELLERYEADLLGFVINPINPKLMSREFITVVFAVENDALGMASSIADGILAEIAKIGASCKLKLAGVERRCGLNT